MARRKPRSVARLERYAQDGPSPRDMVAYSHDPERSRRILSEWRQWQQTYLGRWLAGDADAPPPPHAELFVTKERI